MSRRPAETTNPGADDLARLCVASEVGPPPRNMRQLHYLHFVVGGGLALPGEPVVRPLPRHVGVLAVEIDIALSQEHHPIQDLRRRRQGDLSQGRGGPGWRPGRRRRQGSGRRGTGRRRRGTTSIHVVNDLPIRFRARRYARRSGSGPLGGRHAGRTVHGGMGQRKLEALR